MTAHTLANERFWSNYYQRQQTIKYKEINNNDCMMMMMNMKVLKIEHARIDTIEYDDCQQKLRMIMTMTLSTDKKDLWRISLTGADD